MTQHIAWPTGQQDIVRERIAKHRAADEIIQGMGFENGRGCAVGCSLDNYSHEEFSRVLGVDLRVAKLVDRIHEGLAHSISLDWPGRVAAALTPGADTTKAADLFMVWMLMQGECGKSDSCRRMAGLFSRRLSDDEPSSTEWSEAKSTADAAYAAAASAAAATATAAASSASAYSYAAVYADSYAAVYAAYAAAYASAAYSYAAVYAASADAASADASADAAARRGFYERAATALEEILNRCPVKS